MEGGSTDPHPHPQTLNLYARDRFLQLSLSYRYHYGYCYLNNSTVCILSAVFYAHSAEQISDLATLISNGTFITH